MTKTPYLGLGKPEVTESYGDFIPGVFGNNMDIIDSSLQALSESVLIGSTEIIVDTETKRVSKPIESGTPDRPKEIVMSLRLHEIGQHKYNSIDEVVLPKIRFCQLHYKGSYYAILESDENIPQGTYYVDWVMTLNK